MERYHLACSADRRQISQDIPWKYKWIGLAVVMALPLGEERLMNRADIRPKLGGCWSGSVEEYSS